MERTTDQGIAEIPLAVARHLGDHVIVNAEVTPVERDGGVYEITYGTPAAASIMFESRVVGGR